MCVTFNVFRWGEMGRKGARKGGKAEARPFQLRGLTIMEAAEIREQALALVGAAPLTVDLADTDHIDCAGAQVLLALRAALGANGAALHLSNVPSEIRKYLERAGLDRVLLDHQPAGSPPGEAISP